MKERDAQSILTKSFRSCGDLSSESHTTRKMRFESGCFSRTGGSDSFSLTCFSIDALSVVAAMVVLVVVWSTVPTSNDPLRQDSDVEESEQPAARAPPIKASRTQHAIISLMC